ncbi:MAG: DciA family protein, partial [Pseudomonadota bacterium]
MARAYLRSRPARPVRRERNLSRDFRTILKGNAPKGTTLMRLQVDWTDLVGERLSKVCRPVKLSGAKTGQTLTLRVLPAASALVQHQGETLRQRLSVAAGGTIVRLKLEQGPLPQQPPRRRKKGS